MKAMILVNVTTTASKFYVGDSVTFDDSATGTAQSIALTVPVQPASITFNNSTDTYALTGTAGSRLNQQPGADQRSCGRPGGGRDGFAGSNMG